MALAGLQLEADGCCPRGEMAGSLWRKMCAGILVGHLHKPSENSFFNLKREILRTAKTLDKNTPFNPFALMDLTKPLRGF